MDANTSATPKFRKTRMCKFFEQGCCSKGDKCSFAHKLSALKSRPNLHKTQLCMAFQRNGTCRDGQACKYAHGESELQSSAKQASALVSTLDVQAAPVPVTFQVVMLNAVAGGNISDSQSQAAAVLLQPVQMYSVLTQCSNLINMSVLKGESALKHGRDDDICSVLTADDDTDFEIESLDCYSRQTSEWSSISEADSNELAASESDSSSQCQFTSDARSEVSEDPPVSIKKEECEDVIVSKALEMCLQKTKMCKFFLRGECTKGSQCKFAHDSSGLKNRPNLFRTSLCMAFERSGHCKMGDACKYAHGIDQLQKASPMGDSVGGASTVHVVGSSNADVVDDSLKPAHLMRNMLTHEANGVTVGTKNTFLHLRQQVRETRRRSASC
jgi:hypothetical protein